MPKPPRLDRPRRRAPGLPNWLASRAREGSGGFGCGGFLFAIIRSATGRTCCVLRYGVDAKATPARSSAA